MANCHADTKRNAFLPDFCKLSFQLRYDMQICVCVLAGEEALEFVHRLCYATEALEGSIGAVQSLLLLHIYAISMQGIGTQCYKHQPAGKTHAEHYHMRYILS